MDKNEGENSVILANNRNTVKDKNKNERSLSKRIIQRLNENELNSLEIFNEAPLTARVMANHDNGNKPMHNKSLRE